MQDDDDDQRGLVGWIVGLGVVTAIGTALALALGSAMGGFGPGGTSGAGSATAGAGAATSANSASVATGTGTGTSTGASTGSGASAALTLPMLAKLYFATDAAALSDEAQAAVRAASEAAKAHPAAKIAVSGFHDKTGDADHNANLAKQRAQAVRDALAAAGVDVSRIDLRKPELTEGGGDDREARRVEVRIE